VKKIFTVLFGWITPLGMGIYFIIVHIVGCKIVTFGKKVSVREGRCTPSNYSVTLVKGKVNIGSISFTDKYVNISTYNCMLNKMLIERDRVGIGYDEGELMIILFEPLRELLRVECSKEDFDRLEKFLWHKEKKKYTPIKTRDFSNHLTVEIANIDYSEYKALTKTLTEEFGLIAHGDLIEGDSESFQMFIRGNYAISIEYDIWSGFMVVAQNPESEGLVNEIFEMLLIIRR